MSCERLALTASRYAGGDLDTGAAARFERHLSGCPNCRRLVADLRSTRAALADLRREPVPEEFYGSIRAAVLARLDAPPRPGWRWRPVPARPAWAAAVLLALLSAGALWRLLRPATPLPPVARPLATQAGPATSPAAPREAPGTRAGRGPSIPEIAAQSPAAGAAVRPPARRTAPRFWQLAESSPAASGDLLPAAIVPPTIQPARIRPPSAADPLEIRLVADDPAVTILWLADTQGGNP